MLAELPNHEQTVLCIAASSPSTVVGEQGQRRKRKIFMASIHSSYIDNPTAAADRQVNHCKHFLRLHRLGHLALTFVMESFRLEKASKIEFSYSPSTARANTNPCPQDF